MQPYKAQHYALQLYICIVYTLSKRQANAKHARGMLDHGNVHVPYALCIGRSIFLAASLDTARPSGQALLKKPYHPPIGVARKI